MKIIIIVLIFNCLTHSCFAQFRMNDTTFLLREIKDSIDYGYNFYHAIYFERNRNAKEYDWIADFGFDKFYGKNEYQRDINTMKKELKTKLKTNPLQNIITKWCMLYFYKDSFYVYSPSEYCWNYQFEITDSVVIDKGCERNFSVLDKLIKLSDTHYQLKLKSIRYSLPLAEKLIRTINIYIINEKDGIAIFENSHSGKKEFRLMINAANIKHFPLINNYCKTDKQNEFNFDKIDFDSLLKKYRTLKCATQQAMP